MRTQRTIATLFLFSSLGILCGCGGDATDVERHPECYRRAKYRVADLPLLTDRLADPALTGEHVALFGGEYAEGDLALRGILEVIPDLPFQQFLDDPHREHWKAIGAGAYYAYVRADPSNRIAFQSAVRHWIDQHARTSGAVKWGKREWIPVDGY